MAFATDVDGEGDRGGAAADDGDLSARGGFDGRGTRPARLAFEVSDEALAGGGATARAQLRALAACGFRILVDCFGTGQDALATWRELPVAGLKLDPAIAGQLETEAGRRTAAAGAGLAAGLRIAGIACGIEEPEQAAELRRLGWEFGQGFLFARPEAVRLAA